MLQELPCLGEFLGVSAFSKSVFFTNYKLVKPMLEHRAGIPSAGAPTTLIRSDSSPSEAVSGGTTSAVATRSTSGARLRGSVGGSATLVGPNRRAPTGSEFSRSIDRIPGWLHEVLGRAEGPACALHRHSGMPARGGPLYGTASFSQHRRQRHLPVRADRVRSRCFAGTGMDPANQ
jgi:hypothetical protein